MPNAHQRAEAPEQRDASSDPTIATIRRLAAEAKTLELSIADQEKRLADDKATLGRLLGDVIPSMCVEAKVNGVDVAASGNFPAFKLKVVNFYRASIPVDWDDSKRGAAFEYLEERGAADIIKTAVSVDFPKEERETANKLIDHLKRWGLSYEVKAAVHWKTLTSWLQAEIEGPVRRGEATFPELDVIGGSFGKVARLTEDKS